MLKPPDRGKKNRRGRVGGKEGGREGGREGTN